MYFAIDDKIGTLFQGIYHYNLEFQWHSTLGNGNRLIAKTASRRRLIFERLQETLLGDLKTFAELEAYLNINKNDSETQILLDMQIWY